MVTVRLIQPWKALFVKNVRAGRNTRQVAGLMGIGLDRYYTELRNDETFKNDIEAAMQVAAERVARVGVARAGGAGII